MTGIVRPGSAATRRPIRQNGTAGDDVRLWRRRLVTALAIGLAGAGMLLSGCQTISGTPVAAAARPVASGPSAASSTAGSSTAGPATTEPATTEPATTDPATTDPATTDPATTVPATTVPAPSSAPSPDPSAVGATPSTGAASAVDPQSADPTAYPEGDGVDACQLVAQADAEKLAGTKLDPPVPGEHACTYTGPVTGPTAQVEVYVGLGAKKQLDIEKTLDHPLRALPGVGDEAWLSDTGVYLRKGQLWVSVLVVLLEDPSQYAQRLGDVATVAAGRL